MDKQYKEWLAGLKVGDIVVVNGGFGRAEDVAKVQKVTPKGGVRVKGYTNRLFKNGRVGSTYDSSYELLEPTPELMNKINLSRMRRHLKNVEWDKVSDDAVKRVRELLR